MIFVCVRLYSRSIRNVSNVRSLASSAMNLVKDTIVLPATVYGYLMYVKHFKFVTLTGEADCSP